MMETQAPEQQSTLPPSQSAAAPADYALKDRTLKIILAGVTTFSMVLIPYAFTFGRHLSTAQETWGQFGDYVGGLLNPIFGFLSFYILLTTLIEQRESVRMEQQRHRDQIEREQQRLEDERQHNKEIRGSTNSSVI